MASTWFDLSMGWKRYSKRDMLAGVGQKKIGQQM
jgi:hypothetical protein